MKRLVLPASLLVAACSPGAPTITSVQPIALQAVAWNANGTDLGKIVAVTELEDEVVVYSDQGANVLAGAAVAATDTSVTSWRAAATIPAADGTGAWAVGIDGEGRVQRLRARMALEDVSDRYGLAGANVLGVASQGDTKVAFVLDGGLAEADGATVTRFDEGALTGIAGGSGRVAGVLPDGSVRVLDGRDGTSSTFRTTSAVAVAFHVDGSLYVVTKDALYHEQAGGLALVYQDPSAGFHGLAVSAAWVWIAADGELLGLNGATLYRSSGLGLPKDSTLAPSSSGDAWVIGAGTLQRYAAPVAGDEANWRTAVLPVYARVCSACHAPGGSSGIVLSTYSQWSDRRAKIYDRVIVKGDMPQGRRLADADKAAIAAWASSAK